MKLIWSIVFALIFTFIGGIIPWMLQQPGGGFGVVGLLVFWVMAVILSYIAGQE